MALPLRRRRCWYCKRVGRFGWKPGRAPLLCDECRNDKACFARAEYRDAVRKLRTQPWCPSCQNTVDEGPGGVMTGYWSADPCGSDFHPENGYVL